MWYLYLRYQQCKNRRYPDKNSMKIINKKITIYTLLQLIFFDFIDDINTNYKQHLSIYENAHQEAKFSLDGDYRARIPSKYINEGIDLRGFETSLLDYINSNYGKQN